MATHEIPRAEWAEFFDRFSDEHQGSLVTVDVVGEETGARVQARDLPLIGIELERKGSEANSLDIMLANEPEDHIRHSIRMPERVTLRDEVQGADVALAVEGQDGTTSVVLFTAASAPAIAGGGV